VSVVERDEEIHKLRKENESLIARCTRYREERNAERKNGEDQRVAIKALELERDQMRNGLFQGTRSKHRLVSHCDGDIVKNFPAAKVEVPLVNGITEKWQRQPVMPTTPTSTPRQLKSPVVDKAGNHEYTQRITQLTGTETEQG
ncbi:hypothetical protein FRC03_007905, partial [Tulasnella sp. 419]